jgi:predicted methyltransferase
MRFSPKRQARNIVRGLEHAKEEAIKLQEMAAGKIVVDQAWVGRGPYKRQFWPRARGRVNIRMRPFTHFTVRLRSAETVEKRVEEKERRKYEKIGKALPQYKPIYNPRPYYTW